MKTVIFTRDQEDDLYNDDNVMNALLHGEAVIWRIWYNGDQRGKPTKAEEGDRWFVLQEGKGMIASGVVGTVTFKRGEARLSACGISSIGLIPDKVGMPLIPMEALQEVMVAAKLSLNRKERVLEKKDDMFLLEELWMKADIEENSSPTLVDQEMWMVLTTTATTLTAEVLLSTG